MNFKDFLIAKKIDPEAFSAGDPGRFREFAKLFGQVHPNSFTMQKLHLINNIRRAFPLPADKWQKDSVKSAPPQAKPKMVKPVTGKPEADNSPRPKIRPKPIIKKK